MDDVLRREKKFLLSVAEMMGKEHELSLLLHEDPHNGPGGYTVRSLYFDTEYDDDFFDTEYGMDTRKKLRLRVYDPKSGSAVLEMKQKQGEWQRKRSLRLRREDAERLMAWDYAPLLRYREPFAAECYALMQSRCYRPKVMVQYRRKAFAAKENRIRITFDHQIEASLSGLDLFAPKLLLAPVMDRSQALLEVKYNGFLLSYLQELLSSVDKSEVSASKYCMARHITYQPCL